MPAPGTYRMWQISKADFVQRIQAAFENDGQLVSYIGYPQNAELITMWTGVPISVNRESTEVQSGDLLLYMTLRYRTEGYKGREVNEKDFEFFACLYAE